MKEWFMKRMISHHAAAIKEAQDCLEEAYHPDLLNLCQNIITAQHQEIQVMQTWLCEWYEVCNYRPNLYGLTRRLKLYDKDTPVLAGVSLSKTTEAAQHTTREDVNQVRNSQALCWFLNKKWR